MLFLLVSRLRCFGLLLNALVMVALFAPTDAKQCFRMLTDGAIIPPGLSALEFRPDGGIRFLFSGKSPAAPAVRGAHGSKSFASVLQGEAAVRPPTSALTAPYPIKGNKLLPKNLDFVQHGRAARHFNHRVTRRAFAALVTAWSFSEVADLENEGQRPSDPAPQSQPAPVRSLPILPCLGTAGHATGRGREREEGEVDEPGPDPEADFKPKDKQQSAPAPQSQPAAVRNLPISPCLGTAGLATVRGREDSRHES